MLHPQTPHCSSRAYKYIQAYVQKQLILLLCGMCKKYC